MTITIVAGARPNFVKIAPIIHQLNKAIENGAPLRYKLVHTGQHYDKNLSGSFFEQLGIPEPDVNLDVKSGTQSEQTANIMIRFEAYLADHPTDLVLVVGDVNSTMACSIVAKKMGAKLAHVEAGIRSGDLRMPEEINRIVTDSLADYFYTTSPKATKQLIALGVDTDRIQFVGNVMIDSLLQNQSRLTKPAFWEALNLNATPYWVLTLHRPSNVDKEAVFCDLMRTIATQSGGYPVIFPAHPRTKKILEETDTLFDNLYLVEPLGYLSFIYLVKHAMGVLTDSGGITEEASILNVPCLTFRENTERPETIELGTNVLVGSDRELIESSFKSVLEGNWKQGQPIPLWDGEAAHRIVAHILTLAQDS